jgi:hypothetical protein
MSTYMCMYVFVIDSRRAMVINCRVHTEYIYQNILKQIKYCIVKLDESITIVAISSD